MKYNCLAIVCPQMARVVSIHCPIKASGSTYRLNPLPCRWERYSPIGGRIEDSPFIAFKVPLSKVRKIGLLSQVPSAVENTCALDIRLSPKLGTRSLARAFFPHSCEARKRPPFSRASTR